MPPHVIVGRIARGDMPDVLKLIADSRLASQLQAGASQTRGSIATALLREAEALAQAEQRLEAMGLTNPEFLQAGVESAVLGAGDRVVKVGLSRSGRYEAPAAPGILPYDHTEMVGPLRIGIQERVPFVRPPATGDFGVDREVDRQWRAKADRVYDSLISRGILFADPHGGNVGQFHDGSLVAIDGPFRRAPRPAARPFATTEDAIRALLAPLPGQ